MNIKDDFGAIGDGVTSDKAAFLAFNAWAVQQTRAVQLIMPPGDYIAEYGTRFCLGIKSLVIEGYGASLDYGWMGGWGYKGGYQIGNNSSARIETVAAGAVSILLKNPADASKFAAGSWISVTALDLQGYGAPPNHHYNEFAQIAAIDAVAGVVTLTRPLRNSYKSTYPLYFAGDDYHPDCGGPATIYSLDPSWDTEVKVAGLHFPQFDQVYAPGRRIEYVDCHFDGAGPVPTVNKEFLCRRSAAPIGIIEIDKACEFVEFDHFRVSTIKCQSTSIERLVLNGCHLSNKLLGTVKHTVVRDSDIGELTIGCQGYGASETLLVENSRVGKVTPQFNSDAISDFELSHGSLRNLNVPGPVRWAVPGSKGFLQTTSQLNYGLPFVITNVRRDGNGDTVIDTTLPDALPAMPTNAGAVVKFCSHPMPRITVRNSVGCQDIVDLSNAPDDRPLFSYARRLYFGNIGYADQFKVQGSLVRLRVNVIRAYTGTRASLNFNFLEQAGAITLDLPGNVYDHWNPWVNLKIAGERLIVVGASTGLQTDDNIKVIGNKWFAGGLGPFLGPDIGTEAPDTWPIVEIEIETDQGITAVSNVR